MSRAARTPLLLLLAQGCATTTVESRVTDPAAIAEARAEDQAADPATWTVLIVVLRLKIGADGYVRDAQVVESAGTKADEAAVRAADAALRSRAKGRAAGGVDHPVRVQVSSDS